MNGGKMLFIEMSPNLQLAPWIIQKPGRAEGMVFGGAIANFEPVESYKIARST